MTPQKFTAKSRQGVALVIVLAMLVLLSGLIVAFFNSVRTERNATKADSAVSNARAISDSTVNMVIAQIREATTRYTDSATWASQPGAIRTISGTQGGPAPMDKGAYQYEYRPGVNDYVYKLYSADDMRVKAEKYNIGGEALTSDLQPIETWLKDPLTPVEGYVDMNEPFVTRYPDPKMDTGFVYEPRYPILDPRARADANEKDNANLFGIVEGFDAAPIISSTDERRTALNGQIPLLPMPVKWLYVLKDGTIGPISNATDDNPVVGRTAFWTDDESTKLNINTSTEGTFWDTPSVSSVQESGNVNGAGGPLSSAKDSLALGASQPIAREYQRYPGHPATTCLSPVLGWAWGLSRTVPLNNGDTPYIDFKEAIYRMSPFISSGVGTSLGGFKNTDGLKLVNDGPKDPKVLTATKHLYNNVDEFLFQAERFDTGGAMLHDKVRLTPSRLEKLRGFLTANSRASELNNLNRPRMTLWPLNADERKRSAFDNLFAFTSTLAKNNKFYFVRQDARNSTVDISLKQNVDALAYLQWITGANGGGGPTSKIPGFGPNFATKYGVAGGYKAEERDQLLVSIFDYVRSVNLVDTGTSRISDVLPFIPYTPFFGESGYTGQGDLNERSRDFSGQVTPSRVPSGHPLTQDLQGQGRFLTISEAAMVFYRGGPKITGVTPDKPRGLKMAILFEYATTMPGYPNIRDTYYTKLKRVTRDFIVTPKSGAGEGQPVKILTAGDLAEEGLFNITNISSHEVGQGRAYLPTLGFINPLAYFPEHFGVLTPDNPKDNMFNKTISYLWKTIGRAPGGDSKIYKKNVSFRYYPFVFPGNAGGFADVAFKVKPEDTNEVNPTQFVLQPGKVEFEIYSGQYPGANDNLGRPVQTIELDFANGMPTGAQGKVTLPMPDGNIGQTYDLQARLAEAGNPDQDSRRNIFGGTDNFRVIRSIEYTGPFDNASPITLAHQGDLRLGAGLAFVPSTHYQIRNPSVWMTPTTNKVHGFQFGHGDLTVTDLAGTSPGATTDANNTDLGRLAAGSKGVTAPHNKFPILPAKIDGVTNSDNGPGDYDRGLSKHLDGAFCNKVDEGNLKFDYGDNNDGGKVPYYRGRNAEETGQSYFSPNRQLSSPVMLGSLPTGLRSDKPWQTLLFRPDRSSKKHPGAVIPEDHLLLDFFHLPIVEPYAISEPFATSGKVNLNYIMAPFGYLMTGKNLPKSKSGTGTAAPSSYIHRDTALRGVMRSVKVMAVPSTAAFFAHNESPVPNTTKFRYDIDLDETIAHIQKRFLDPKRGLFRSASEICTVDLYPAPNQGATNPGIPVSNWNTFWDSPTVGNTQTGDNMRERPYSHIYPRITTKSNVYNVHMRCQAVTVAPTARKDGKIDYTNILEKDIQVQAEYRGSALIERFVDPNDQQLENYKYQTKTVDPYYRFRVIGTKQFNPR